MTESAGGGGGVEEVSVAERAGGAGLRMIKGTVV